MNVFTSRLPGIMSVKITNACKTCPVNRSKIEKCNTVISEKWIRILEGGIFKRV